MMTELSQLPDASTGVERGQAPDSAPVPLELGELRAVGEVPDDDGVVPAARREPAAVERSQARHGVAVPLQHERARSRAALFSIAASAVVLMLQERQPVGREPCSRRSHGGQGCRKCAAKQQ